jgi:hypothetical protein
MVPEDGRMYERMEIIVRMRTASIVFGSLVLMGALPAAAGQLTSVSAPVRLAANGDSTVDRDTYLQ